MIGDGPVAAGATSEVFAWSDDRVLKLFRPAFQYAVELEASRARAARLTASPPLPADALEMGLASCAHALLRARPDNPHRTALEALARPFA